MTGKSHLLIGLMSTAAVHRIYFNLADNWLEVALVGAVAAVGALLPDIDSDESTIRQATGTARSNGCIGRVASALLRVFGGHRVLTHTLVMWLALSAIAWFVGNALGVNALAVAFSVGYLSHLIADAVTVDGIPALWPISQRRVCLLPSFIAVRTGGIFEYGLLVVMGVWLVGLWRT